VEQEPAEGKEPVAHRVQAWERHVARADHERHEVVSEADQGRHHDEEDHRRAVHREELVERLRSDERVVRDRELQADDERLGPADGKEEERGEEIEDADPLVVDGRRPGKGVVVLGRVRVDGRGGRRGLRGVDGGHRSVSK
jgi:hypothetical protein